MLSKLKFVVPPGHTIMEIIEDIVDDPNHATVVIDQTGRVIFCNKTYLRQLSFLPQNVLGKHIDDLYPSNRMSHVLKTGIPQKYYVFTVNGSDFIASSYPIFKDGKVVGVIGRSLFLTVEDAVDFCKMMANIQAQVKELRETEQTFKSKRYDFNKLIGYSPIFKKAKTLAKQIAQNNTTVLITGESGTGKDVFAKAIHYDGIRKNGPFIRVNCAAIPEQLLESELFGYNEGTFTGALKGGKRGKFELANGGTIFLDEIGEMPLSMQAKLLVVLQDKEIEPLGHQSEHPKKVDVRIIAATNQNLQKMVSEGSFRQDLFYRLNVINLHLPPLRHRKEDILPLGKYILNVIASRHSLQVTRCEPETEKIMNQYDWPGNVRELENCIESALWMASLEGQTTIGPKYMREVFSKYIANPMFQHPGSIIPITQGSQLPTMKDYINLCEKRLLEEVLKTTSGDKNAASKILDLHISALYKKINKYGLTM